MGLVGAALGRGSLRVLFAVVRISALVFENPKREKNRALHDASAGKVYSWSHGVVSLWRGIGSVFITARNCGRVKR